MAPLSVDTPFWLRPWENTGLAYLLVPADLPVPWSLTQTQAPVVTARPPRRPRRDDEPTVAGLRYIASRCRKSAAANDDANEDAASVQMPSVQNRSVAVVPPSPPQQKIHTPLQATRRQLLQTQPTRTRPANEPALPQQHPAGHTQETTLPLQDWPPLWQKRLQSTRPGRVLWTYWSLGTDLCGSPDARRRDFFRRLLTDLAHPAGTHTFWPCALPQLAKPADLPDEFRDTQRQSDAMHTAPDIFWAGVRALQARAVILMGSAAMRAVLSTPLPLMGQARHNGCLVWVVRDVDLLLEQPHHYAPTLEFLRHNLQGLTR